VSVLLNLSIMATANQTLLNFTTLVVELRSGFNGGKKKRVVLEKRLCVYPFRFASGPEEIKKSQDDNNYAKIWGE
ncbi:hypothetical protein U1Q18_026348, partial [Sarracenia purpurea var. burkii]